MSTCPACGAEVLEALDPLDGPILLNADSTPHTCGRLPRTWVLELPAGLRLLSLNDRHHWAVKGRITRDLRKAAFVMARNARIPHLQRAAIEVEYQPPLVTRRRDLDNVPAASGKPCIDGVVDAGVLSDDSSRYVEGILHRIGTPYPKGRIVLRITEVLPAAATGIRIQPPGGDAA
jgi:crossover junction endodeoxyribonuclease RusA